MQERPSSYLFYLRVVTLNSDSGSRARESDHLEIPHIELEEIATSRTSESQK
jgi:hypothetical protein